MKYFAFFILIFVGFVINTFTQNKPLQELNTPTETYKKLYAAVKSKDTDSIKQTMSKKTIEFCEFVAENQKKSIDEVYRNGLTATTLSKKMPRFRNERTKNGFGRLMVKNPKGKWEDLPFVFEDGSWKLAMGEIFAGTYKKP